MEKEKFQELSENEKGQLQGGFALEGGGESNFFNTNTNCNNDGWVDTNTNCKCAGCPTTGTVVISRPTRP